MKVIDVARATGIHRNMITLLYAEEAERVQLKDLEKLCVLFKCRVGDLLEYIPVEQPSSNSSS